MVLKLPLLRMSGKEALMGFCAALCLDGQSTVFFHVTLVVTVQNRATCVAARAFEEVLVDVNSCSCRGTIWT